MQAAVGSLRAVRGADLALEVAGVVADVHLKSGDDVKAGQPLLDLIDADETAQLKQLRANAALASATFDRAKRQMDVEAISKADYDTAAADLKARQAAVAQQEAVVAKKHLRAPFDGRAGMAQLADSLQLEIDELLPIAETLQLLRFAELQGANLVLTPAARQYAQFDVDQRKAMFARALLAYVPLAQHIRRILDERASHTAPARRFRDELEDHMSPDYADETLRTVTLWGRYAEVFAYHEDADRFSLDDPT